MQEDGIIFFKKFIEIQKSNITRQIKGKYVCLFMSNYNKLLVDTCHKRGAFGMGGMSAQVIAKANPKEVNEKALAGVKKDKERELNQGKWSLGCSPKSSRAS